MKTEKSKQGVLCLGPFKNALSFEFSGCLLFSYQNLPTAIFTKRIWWRATIVKRRSNKNEKKKWWGIWSSWLFLYSCRNFRWKDMQMFKKCSARVCNWCHQYETLEGNRDGWQPESSRTKSSSSVSLRVFIGPLKTFVYVSFMATWLCEFVSCSKALKNIETTSDQCWLYFLFSCEKLLLRYLHA